MITLRFALQGKEARGGTVRYPVDRDEVHRMYFNSRHEARRPGWTQRRADRKEARTVAAQQMQRERRESRAT